MPHRPACEQAFTSKYCVNELAAASRTPESISDAGGKRVHRVQLLFSTYLSIEDAGGNLYDGCPT
jgi:hypothetical protein